MLIVRPTARAPQSRHPHSRQIHSSQRLGFSFASSALSVCDPSFFTLFRFLSVLTIIVQFELARRRICVHLGMVLAHAFALARTNRRIGIALSMIARRAQTLCNVRQVGMTFSAPVVRLAAHLEASKLPFVPNNHLAVAEALAFLYRDESSDLHRIMPVKWFNLVWVEESRRIR